MTLNISKGDVSEAVAVSVVYSIAAPFTAISSTIVTGLVDLCSAELLLDICLPKGKLVVKCQATLQADDCKVGTCTAGSIWVVYHALVYLLEKETAWPPLVDIACKKPCDNMSCLISHL